MSWKEIMKKDYMQMSSDEKEDDTPKELLNQIDDLYKEFKKYHELVTDNTLPITRTKWENWWIAKYGPLINELKKFNR